MGMWWIESIKIRKGNYYKFHIEGWNDLAQELIDLGREVSIGPAFSWSVPTLSNRHYAFRLKVVN